MIGLRVFMHFYIFITNKNIKYTTITNKIFYIFITTKPEKPNLTRDLLHLLAILINILFIELYMFAYFMNYVRFVHFLSYKCIKARFSIGK